MRPIPSHIVRSLEIEAPQFARAVALSTGQIEIPWALVDERPELLYYCVWYALCHGKDVTVQVPEV